MNVSTNTAATPSSAALRFKHLSWRVAPFQPQGAKVLTPLRAWAVALAIRFMLSRGYVVLLVGRCRTGKTYLVQRTTPGRVIDGSKNWQQSVRPVLFHANTVPQGKFSIDELAQFEASSVLDWLANKSADRQFILTVQSRTDLYARRIGPVLHAMGRKVLLVDLNG